MKALDPGEGIRVAAFEQRLDLLRAVLFGPLDTPYSDGVFVFDILLPSDYPHSPPLVHYHSTLSERLNPNLYVSNDLCPALFSLSLSLSFSFSSEESLLLLLLILLLSHLKCGIDLVVLIRVVHLALLH